jgi:hypothetical protein
MLIKTSVITAGVDDIYEYKVFQDGVGFTADPLRVSVN